jgi:pimeloyl-ACP methyl ester carboxylesterase
MQAKQTGHLCVILPGYRHTADMPDLHYPGQILLAQGADLLRIEYAYPKTDFITRPNQEQSDWIRKDVLAACTAGMKKRSYRKITLIGKSLGTLAMAHLLDDPRFAAASCVWSTPILASGWLCAQIKKHRPRSLFIIGTADPYYLPAILEELIEATKGKLLVLEGADHSLEIPDDVEGSLSALHQIVDGVQEFIA